MISNIRIALFLILGATAILLVSCRRFSPQGDDVVDDLTDDELVADDFPADIINVPGHISLYYSIDTFDVYSTYIENGIENLETFTSNNHLCKYINGRVVEVVDDELVAIVHSANLPN